MSHNFGNTINFQFASPDGFWAGLSAAQQTDVTANANYLMGQVEPAFTTTTGWFGTDTSKFGTSTPSRYCSTSPTAVAPPTTATAIRSTSTPRAMPARSARPGRSSQCSG
jgi:hypothetical protein